MNNRILTLCAIAILASAATAADKEKAAFQPAQEECVSHCTRAERRCSADVRRARSQCSRKAANAGRDPFTGRNKDTSYFCGHFSQPENECSRDAYGAACQGRFQYRYGLCVDAMYNIASLRFDCIKSEREAMGFCREELRDCTAACQ
jgi:hypothetical protein